MGPVVALIGLELSGSAASNAGLLDDKIDPKNVIVFAVTLGVAVFGNILFRGFLSVIPILIAVIAGYLTALACGILDFTQVVEASWFAIPTNEHIIDNTAAPPITRTLYTFVTAITPIFSPYVVVGTDPIRPDTIVEKLSPNKDL